jgi:hypothetical protein
MQQGGMLKYVYLYVTSVPEGGMNLRSMDIYEQHDKHFIMFHSHCTELSRVLLGNALR